MDWVKWAIPLIVLTVWILANLARVPREPPRPPVRRPRPPLEGEPSAEGPQKPVTDVDRFLEEVSRRRRQATERRLPVQDQALPKPRPERRSPERRRISPTDVPPESRTPAQVLPVDVPVSSLPVVRLVPIEVRPKEPPPAPTAVPDVPVFTPSKRLVDNTIFPDLAPDAAQPTLAPTAAPGKAQIVARAPITESAGEVLAMLRDPRSVRVAFLLREILEPPLCRRGPRRLGRPG